MKKIFKYKVPIDGTPHTLQMPANYKVIHVGCQDGENVCFWAEVDPSSPEYSIGFWVLPTGATVPDGHWEHLGTALYGSYVWHLYENTWLL